MTPPRSDQGFVRMPDAEFEAMLARAAEKGAKRALADVGLDGEEAALDIRDLRSLLDCIRLVRRTAMQTAVRMITTGVMLALLAGSRSSSRSSAAARSRPSHNPRTNRPAHVAGFFVSGGHHDHDLLRPLARRAKTPGAGPTSRPPRSPAGAPASC